MAGHTVTSSVLKFFAALCCAVVVALPLHAQRFALQIDDIVGPDFSIRGMTSALTTGVRDAFTIKIDSITLGGQVWRNARLNCPDLRVAAGVWNCAQATLDVGEPIPLAFTYDPGRKTVGVVVSPAAGERWQLAADFGGKSPHVDVAIERGHIGRLARWMPAGLPTVKSGIVTGKIVLDATQKARAELTIEALGFSDSSGLHAGENIGLRLAFEATPQGDRWKWAGSGRWQGGELYWHPIYLKANAQAIVAAGAYEKDRVTVESAEAALPGIGPVTFNGTAWNLEAQRLERATVIARNLPVAEVYEQWLKPFLAGTALADMRAAGEVSLSLELRDGNVDALDLNLARVSVEDRQRRFALFDLSGSMPWRRGKPVRGEITVSGGEILRLPFGGFRLPLQVQDGAIRIERVGVPLLGGELSVNDFEAGLEETGWRWRFRGSLSPVPMESLTQSVGLPVMHGTLSGVIPEVVYDKSTLRLGGALVFNVFDGTVTARNVTLGEPLGRVPRLTMDLDMQKLDLDLLTRAFSFGSMTGRVDVRVAGLELVNWKPTHFDARLASSPGDYPRWISQTAVQNISALGGAGAAAAIQRSILRFFDRFGYEKLGLTCRLRNNVCVMGGVEDAPQGYVIVKGGGIPALSVIGYNRQVNWPELIGRLQRIMQENVQAVVR